MEEYQLQRYDREWRTAHKTDGQIKKRERNIYSAYGTEYDVSPHLVCVVRPQRDVPVVGESILSCYIGLSRRTWHEVKSYSEDTEHHVNRSLMVGGGLHTKTGELSGVIYYDPASKDDDKWHRHKYAPDSPNLETGIPYDRVITSYKETDPNLKYQLHPMHPRVGLYADRTYYYWHYYLGDSPTSEYDNHNCIYVRNDMHSVCMWLDGCHERYEVDAQRQRDFEHEKRNEISLYHIGRLKACANEIQKICAEHIDIYDNNNNLVA